ncbi:hypothetical protein [Modestobacter lapidis]|nr:hypothetical protein [Modestobacter lapidis]
MTTAQPTRPVTVPPAVRASALAAWQLVEDARNRAPERRRRGSMRSRVLVQRAVADRRAERARQTG